MKTILFIAAHADDELTSAGTLIKLIQEGHDVIYLALSTCGNEALKGECENACNEIGITDIKTEDYPVRHFNAHRQEILQTLIDWRNKLEPDIIFCPATLDLHQDHQVVNSEVKRAFKKHDIFGYDFCWNTNETRLQGPSEIDVDQLERKITAMSHYHSQQHRPYFDPFFIRSLAKVRGVQFGVDHAEAFEVIRAYI